jgi:16S rRNA (adenine1518-N6/adenine1519-N6)-dimethyltransferase
MQKKKSLGQHFLHAASHLRAVADAAQIRKGEVVLEIGPGDGALTAELLARGAHVVAVEKDSRLISPLREKFSGQHFEVIEGDALDYEPTFSSYKVVGNVPYYITGALLKKFLSADKQPTDLLFLVQKEVAERIAREKKESILSLSVKAYGEPKYIKTVPAGAFSPPPNVDSAILAVYNISRAHFKNAEHEARFFETIKKGFAQKRKLLARNLGASYAEALMREGIAPNARAEEIALPKWIGLSLS